MALENFPKEIQEFFHDRKQDHATAQKVRRDYQKAHSQKSDEAKRSFAWILAKSRLPWLELSLRAPFQTILKEAQRVRHLFVSHRDDPKMEGYVSKGWKALCLHGISPEKTMSFSAYGYKSEDETPYRWTEIARLCPKTTEYFQKTFPYDHYYRLRFSILEPGGYILPHVDRGEKVLWEINLALNHPKGCLFKMEGQGYVPQRAKSGFILDVSNRHAVINSSKEDRYHIIVHGSSLRNEKFHRLIERSYLDFLNL